MKVIQYDPTPRLSRYVKSVTLYEDYVCNYKYEKLLPSEYPQLIIDLDEKTTYAGILEKNNEHNFQAHRKSWFSGIFTKPLTYIAQHISSAASIQFHPFALNAIWGINGDELVNRLIPGDSILGNKTTELIEKMLAEKDLKHKLDKILAFLEKEVSKATSDYGVSEYISRSIVSTNRSIQDIYSEISFSNRHLIKTFQSQVGITPKKLQNLKKVSTSLPHLHNRTYNTAQIAASCGFYDQSHFIQTFKSFNSMTPGDYISAVKPYPHVLYFN